MLCATNRGQYEWACYMPSADHDLRPEKGVLFPVPTRMRAGNALGWGGNL